MNKNTTTHPRNRADILSDMLSIKSAISGKITQKTRTLKDGRTAVYHQLQQWIGGKNVTTHIPVGKLKEFSVAVDNYKNLSSLIEELSSSDISSILEGNVFGDNKKNAKNNRRLRREDISNSTKKP